MNVFVNTWSVEGFISEGCSRPSSAGARTRSGCRRTAASRRRLRGRDLPEAARRQHARALLDPDRPGAVRLPGHPQRVDLDRRLFHRARREARCSTGRPATTPTTPATTPCCRCTRCSARRQRQPTHAHPGRARDRRRHRRARRPALRPQEERLLVRLAAFDRGDAPARALPERHRLQVTSAVLAGMVWALENPNAGIVEADEMDYRRCLEVQSPISARSSALHRLDAAPHRPRCPRRAGCRPRPSPSR